MEWMDRARTVGGLLWVAAGVVFEALWLAQREVSIGPVTMTLLAAITALAVVVTARPRSQVAWLAGWAVAALLALDLAGAVADRYGALGGPGEAGVSWGSWEAFVDYTSTLLGDPPHVVAAVAGALATALEVLLALLLASGWQRRWVGKALAGLFTVYLLTMAWTIGVAEVARYGMPVLIGGALLVSASPVRRTVENGSSRETATTSRRRPRTGRSLR